MRSRPRRILTQCSPPLLGLGFANYILFYGACAGRFDLAVDVLAWTAFHKPIKTRRFIDRLSLLKFYTAHQQMSHYLVTGATGGSTSGAGAPNRLEINVFVKQEDQFSLYIQALRE